MSARINYRGLCGILAVGMAVGAMMLQVTVDSAECRQLPATSPLQPNPQPTTRRPTSTPPTPEL